MTDSTYADTDEMRTRCRAGSILATLVPQDARRVDAFHDLTAAQCDDVVRWADREPPSMAGVNSLFARMFGGEVRA